MFGCGPEQVATQIAPDTQALIRCQEQNKAARKQILETNNQILELKQRITQIDAAKSKSEYATLIMVFVAAFAFLFGIALGSSAKKEAKVNNAQASE